MKASVQIVRGIESLFGTRDENIRLIENGLKVSTQLIDNRLEIEGEPANVSRAESILEDYAALVCEGHAFNNGDLNSYLRVVPRIPTCPCARWCRVAGSVVLARKWSRLRPSISAVIWKR